MATGFSGGIGDTREELCGALSGGVMVIGGLLGRSSADGDDQPAIRAVARYREHFLEQFGYTQCGELREKVVDASCGPGSCAALVEEAAAILMAVLDETA
jgi:C_GCAxxG_C_C family probable redox protein